MKAKKICLLGSFAVGKTSLVARFVHSMYSDDYHTTVGVKVDKKVVDAGDDQVKLMIWDIAGKDEFFSPPASYFRGSSGFLIVIDGTRKATVDVAKELFEQASKATGDVPFTLLLNKWDLRSEWEVEDPSLQSFVDAGVPILKTSAKTGEHVEQAFTELAQRMIAG